MSSGSFGCLEEYHESRGLAVLSKSHKDRGGITTPYVIHELLTTKILPTIGSLWLRLIDYYGSCTSRTRTSSLLCLCTNGPCVDDYDDTNNYRKIRGRPEARLVREDSLRIKEGEGFPFLLNFSLVEPFSKSTGLTLGPTLSQGPMTTVVSGWVDSDPHSEGQTDPEPSGRSFGGQRPRTLYPRSVGSVPLPDICLNRAGVPRRRDVEDAEPRPIMDPGVRRTRFFWVCV